MCNYHKEIIGMGNILVFPETESPEFNSFTLKMEIFYHLFRDKQKNNYKWRQKN